MIVATGVRTAGMTGATAAMTAGIDVADPGCCAGSTMGALTKKPMAGSPQSRSTQVVHGSVT
jgi:hypothetical protein